MRQHADPRVHEFAELIAESGDGWQTDRKVYEFIQIGRPDDGGLPDDGEAYMGDIDV